jgi:hypothetical protein
MLYFQSNAIESKVLIGVHLRPSAASNEFFSPSQGADAQSLMTLCLEACCSENTTTVFF